MNDVQDEKKQKSAKKMLREFLAKWWSRGGVNVLSNNSHDLKVK